MCSSDLATNNTDFYGMGSWDVMCLGCYNNDSHTPVGYSAYEKVFMGWAEYIKPKPGTKYTLTTWNKKNALTDKAVCIVSDVNKNEYFILENRARQGWDRYISGQGLLVTHITYSSSLWTNNKPNNDKIQSITILPADNKLSRYSETGDLWPQGGRRELTDQSTPATVLNMDSLGNITGKAGMWGKPVTEITMNSDGTVSFWYMKPQPMAETNEAPVMQSASEEYIGMNGFLAEWNHEASAQDVESYTLEVRASTIESGGMPHVSPSATEEGDSTTRLITGITGKSYLVNNLLGGGTFRYRVKALYVDQSESEWSNAQSVTLFEKGHGYDLGDGNHDGSINVTDITILISYILGIDVNCCAICADADPMGDESINVTDVTRLIDIVLLSE